MWVLHRIKPNWQYNRSVKKSLKKNREENNEACGKNNPEEGLFETGFEEQAAFHQAEKQRKDLKVRENQGKQRYEKN